MDHKVLNMDVNGEKWRVVGVKAVRKFYKLLADAKTATPMNNAARGGQAHRSYLQVQAAKSGKQTKADQVAKDEQLAADATAKLEQAAKDDETKN